MTDDFEVHPIGTEQRLADLEAAITAAIDAAVAIERERCAQIAARTVCDTHLPTGVRIYGTAAAKAIRGT